MRTVRYFTRSIADCLRIVTVASVASMALNGLSGRAQTSISSQANIAAEQASPSPTSLIPQQIRFSGTVLGRSGDTVEAVFRIYAAPEGGDPLWSETQRVAIASDGRYTVLLGSASESGLPHTVFAAGQARWLGVSVERGEEQPRTPLTSVPYAMKAADAETLAGQPASEFVTQAQFVATARTLAAQAAAIAIPEATALTGAGTADYLPLWTSSSALGSSILFQSGTTKVGIATKTPTTTLDVDGPATVRGTLNLPTAIPATDKAAADSPLLELGASGYNSTSKAAVVQNFAWRAVATGNNSSAPTANLELLFGSGAATPTVTGLAISTKGIVTFAKGQTFPAPASGPGSGTITGVTAGTALTGGGVTGPITLSVDTTKVPLLASANTFTGSQIINGIETINGLPGRAALTINGFDGVEATSSNSGGVGVTGNSPGIGVLGNSTLAGVSTIGLSNIDNVGVYGAGPYGVVGDGGCCTGGIAGSGAGVLGAGVFGVQGATYGPAFSVRGWGVVGYVVGAKTDYSKEGTSFAGSSNAGVWGDDTGEGGSGSGVLATGDSNTALIAANNSEYPTSEVYNYSSNQHVPVFETFSPYAWGPNSTNPNSGTARYCVIDTSANLECSGAVEAQVANPDADGKVHAMYAMQSPEVWFEDFGSGTLANGAAHISLEPIFGGTVNSGMEYHVFLTPKGDCEGLYVANEGTEGFDVRELRHGKSSVGFDFRIVAKRKGYETVRMEDLTPQAEARNAREADRARRMAEAATHPTAPPPRRLQRIRPPARPSSTPQMLGTQASAAAPAAHVAREAP